MVVSTRSAKALCAAVKIIPSSARVNRIQSMSTAATKKKKPARAKAASAKAASSKAASSKEASVKTSRAKTSRAAAAEPEVVSSVVSNLLPLTNKPTSYTGDRRLLFDLATRRDNHGDDDNDDADASDLVLATLVKRPSKRNKSPYVADIWLEEEQREALVHLPNLDMGGKCVAGVSLLVKAARTPKGIKVGADAVSPKYGTPKCEFHAQLVHVDESSFASPKELYPPTWVGAHPALGEQIARHWLEENLIAGIPPITSIKRQVTLDNPCGNKMRTDFVVTHATGLPRLVEVKTVVDTDYHASFLPPTSVKCVFAATKTTDQALPYTRTALFPWGNSKQVGPEGEPVVSARTIHHDSGRRHGLLTQSASLSLLCKVPAIGRAGGRASCGQASGMGHGCRCGQVF